MRERKVKLRNICRFFGFHSELGSLGNSKIGNNNYVWAGYENGFNALLWFINRLIQKKTKKTIVVSPSQIDF